MAELNPGGAANWANLQAGSFILAQHVLLEDTCCQDLSLPKVTLLIINFTKKKNGGKSCCFTKMLVSQIGLKRLHWSFAKISLVCT